MFSYFDNQNQPACCDDNLIVIFVFLCDLFMIFISCNIFTCILFTNSLSDLFGVIIATIFCLNLFIRLRTCLLRLYGMSFFVDDCCIECCDDVSMMQEMVNLAYYCIKLLKIAI